MLILNYYVVIGLGHYSEATVIPLGRTVYSIVKK